MFRELLTLDEAQQIIRQHFRSKPVGVDEVGLLDAYGRVLAGNVYATLSIPPFDRSTVDGYAVRAEDTYGADENKPSELRVAGAVKAGKRPKRTVKQGIAVEIVTGAPMPDGADAVVMLEHTERREDGLAIFDAVVQGENVMKTGADISKNETVLRDGQLLGSREIGVLAAIGCARVKVYAIPHVAILSTGAEIEALGKRLPAGKVYDINAYSLGAAVLESGGKTIHMGVFPDEIAEMQKALTSALASADAVVTSGGVSVGSKDIMPKVLESLGRPGIIICGIAIKPGKPTTIASIGGKPVFSLPGHPASALLVFHLLAKPIIQGMAGRKMSRQSEVKALAAERMFTARGRRTFIMVKLRRDKSGTLVAEPLPTGLSGAITTLANADGYVEIDESRQFIDAGEKVGVQVFDSNEVGVECGSTCA